MATLYKEIRREPSFYIESRRGTILRKQVERRHFFIIIKKIRREPSFNRENRRETNFIKKVKRRH